MIVVQLVQMNVVPIHCSCICHHSTHAHRYEDAAIVFSKSLLSFEQVTLKFMQVQLVYHIVYTATPMHVCNFSKFKCAFTCTCIMILKCIFNVLV